MVYYNEIDPYAAQWLRNLIAARHIAAGEVDVRSICDVDPADLAGFTQCHFFAGIGVWSHALRLAGWPDDRPVWTGSCPCQPFSAAGKRGGFDDERHLWPEFFRLIRERRPPVVFGEQVASKDGLQWLDAVQADLESASYASAAADLCAAGVGAPHIRQRLYWVADAGCVGREVALQQHRSGLSANGLGQTDVRGGDGALGRVANNNKGLEGRWESGRECGTERAAGPSGVAGGLADAQHDDGRADEQGRGSDRRAADGGGGAVVRMADADAASKRVVGASDICVDRWETRYARAGSRGSSPTNGHWRDADWLYCRDGKWRPVEPGTFPLAHGAAARVGRLRAYGNAIVPQVAQAFIEAFMECRP